MSEFVRVEPVEVRSLLHERRDVIQRLAAMHNIGGVRLFGSVARGNDHERSDVDLLIDAGVGTSYFDIAGFATDVEAVIQRPVDVLSAGALNRERKSDRQILADATEL